MTIWRISVLGPFVVQKGDEPLTDKLWRSRQTRTILKLLLTRRGQVVAADQLIDILWPDADERRARRNLHVRLSQLRRVLADDSDDSLIHTIDGGYAFRQTAVCTVDVVEFEEKGTEGRQHLDAGRLDQAIAYYEQARSLYQGDFLAEDLYEPWTFNERERLREQYLTLLTELAEAYAQQGKYRRAMQLCRQALSADPVREAVYVRLMLYHYYAGEQDQALRTFARCQQVLAAELEVPPLPETTALAQQIRTGTLLAGSPHSYPSPVYDGRLFDVPYSLGSPPLVGRAREYAWLVERWRDPATTLLLVMGEAGVGKSYLINHFCRYLRGQQVNCATLTGRLEAQLPYSDLHSFIKTHPDWLPQLDDETRTALLPLFPYATGARTACPPLADKLSALQETARLRSALLALLKTGLPAGAMLVVDDAQWVDPSSLAVLLAWAEKETAVFVYRPAELAEDHPLAPGKRPFAHVAELLIRPLTEAAVTGLVTQLAGRPLPALATQLVAQSGGSPLFVIAALQHLFEQGELLVTPDGSWLTTDKTAVSLPPSLRQTIAARLARLPRSQQNVVDVLAVAGGGADFALLAQVTETGPGALFALVDALLADGLLLEPRQPGDSELALAHSYYREVAYDAIPGYRRRYLHGQMAWVLAALSPSEIAAPAIAHHYLQAEQQQPAADWFGRAGEAALARFALAESKAYFQQALDLGVENAAAVWARVGQIAHQQASYEESAAAYTEALALHKIDGEQKMALQVQLGLAESLREASRFSEALKNARAVLAETAVLRQHPALYAKAHIILSNVYRSGQLASVPEIQDHLQQGLALAEAAGETQLMGEAQFWLGVLAVNQGDAQAALRHDEAALAHFEPGNQAGWLTITYNNLAYHALLAGQPRRALVWAQQGLALAEKVEARHATGWLLSTLGEIQIHLGLLAEATQTLKRGVALVTAYGPPRLKPGFLVDMALVKLAQSDFEAAQATLQEAALLAAETAPQFVPRVQVLLAEAFWGLGDLAMAQQFAETASAAATTKRQQRILGQAWRVQASLAAAQGEFDRAALCFATSHDVLVASGDVLEGARTKRAWGRWLAAQGETEQSAALLAAAAETFAACESVLDSGLL